MKQIYPTPSYFIKLKLENKDAFLTRLKNMTSPPLAGINLKNKSPFIGVVRPYEFYIQVKTQFYRNAFRPLIAGKIQDDHLTIHLANNPTIYLSLIVVLSILGYEAFQSNSMLFVSLAMIWPFLWYSIGWLLYVAELKKTEEAIKKLERIILQEK